MNTKYTTLIVAGMIVLLSIPALAATPAQNGDTIMPPDSYFIMDGYGNGQPIHEGPQIGFRFFIPSPSNGDMYTPGGYLGITEYKLGQSHNDQEKIALGHMFYFQSIPDVPYVAPQHPYSEMNSGIVSCQIMNGIPFNFE